MEGHELLSMSKQSWKGILRPYRYELSSTWNKLRRPELRVLYSSVPIVGLGQRRKLRWDDPVIQMRETHNLVASCKTEMGLDWNCSGAGPAPDFYITVLNQSDNFYGQCKSRLQTAAD